MSENFDDIPVTLPPVGKPFQFMGHEILLLDPILARITITVPWQLDHELTAEEKQKVIETTESVVRWASEERLLPGSGIGLMVMMKPKPVAQ